jgi:hypothetical protein
LILGDNLNLKLNSWDFLYKNKNALTISGKIISKYYILHLTSTNTHEDWLNFQKDKKFISYRNEIEKLYNEFTNNSPKMANSSKKSSEKVFVTFIIFKLNSILNEIIICYLLKFSYFNFFTEFIISDKAFR